MNPQAEANHKANAAATWRRDEFLRARRIIQRAERALEQTGNNKAFELAIAEAARIRKEAREQEGGK